jgi:hypothetical protein
MIDAALKMPIGLTLLPPSSCIRVSAIAFTPSGPTCRSLASVCEARGRYMTLRQIAE